MSITALTKSQARFEKDRNGFKDLGRPIKTKAAKVEQGQKERLHLTAKELEFLDFIADQFEKSPTRFKKVGFDEVMHYLRNANSSTDPYQALEKAFKFAQGFKPRSPHRKKLRQIAKSIVSRYIKEHASEDIIGSIQDLARKKGFNKHILMLGESHVSNKLKDGGFHNPPTAWLEEHLDELKEAGYDTLALEVPYDARGWLEQGNRVWGGVKTSFAIKYIANLEKIRTDIENYLQRRNIEPDKGTVLFFEKVDNWIAQKKQELVDQKRISTLKPGQPKKEKTRTRWHQLAQKAHAKGFEIIQTDASRKTTSESEKIIYYFLDEIDTIHHKTDGLKAIKDYLLYKRGLILRFRDLSMAQRLTRAFKKSNGNIISLYGANHATRHVHNGRTSAFRELQKSKIPTITARMEFPGMTDNDEHVFLEPRITTDKALILKCSDMPFAGEQKPSPRKLFDVKDGRFYTRTDQNPTLGELEPFDSVILFPKQNSKDQLSKTNAA